MHLEFNERRVLGVLIEKAYATPEQYPLTMNALVAGANQKSCRDPISHLDEEQVWNALDTLRRLELAALIRTTGGRTDRFRQKVGDAWGLEGKHAAVLAELLLRGPQTDGELRQRASRMVRIESLEELAQVIESLIAHDPPLVRRLTPEGQRRGAKYAHMLYPPREAPALETGAASFADDDRETRAPARSRPADGRVDVDGDPDVVAELRREIAALAARVRRLEEAVGD